MKASELVVQINQLIAQHGDLEVRKEYDSMASKVDTVSIGEWESQPSHWIIEALANRDIEKSKGFIVW